MAKKKSENSADYILPLYINGLEGRMLRLPPPRGKKREILFVYGQHSSLERWWGLVQEFNKFGAVTMADMPGFGGMESLYKIGQDASIDNLADYLAAFLKLRYKNKKVTIAGMSLGFVIVTRMLQRYPDLTKKVDLLVSVVGFGHRSDFIFSRPRYRAYRFGSYIFCRRFPAWIFQHVFLRPAYLRRVYSHSYNAKEKFENLAGDDFDRTMDMEIELWKVNDIRTQMRTSHEMLMLNNCNKRVNLPLLHVASKTDRYFDNTRVEEHMRQIFNDFQVMYMKEGSHAPTVIADTKSAAPFIPDALRKILREKK
jgi:pimeloyl-ACP methyl ester carboxylesterase